VTFLRHSVVKTNATNHQLATILSTQTWQQTCFHEHKSFSDGCKIHRCCSVSVGESTELARLLNCYHAESPKNRQLHRPTKSINPSIDRCRLLEWAC